MTSQHKPAKIKFSERMGMPPVKRAAIERSVSMRKGSPTELSDTRKLAIVAHDAGMPLPWLAAKKTKAVGIPESLLRFCENAPLAEVPIINGRPADPNTLANFYNVVATAAATGARSQAAAAASGSRKAELVADIMAAAYLFEALSYPWQTVLRLRCYAESLKDPTPGTAVSTVELTLRATIAAAVLAKAKALGDRHGVEAQARRDVLSKLRSLRFDLNWFFRRKKANDDRTEQDRYERNLKDWHEDFKKKTAGSNGQEAAQREYDFLAALVEQADAPDELVRSFCDFAVEMQAAIQ